jgi:hypothetical protein
VYLALFTAISDDETGTECADTAYGRKAVSFGAATNGVGSNDTEVEFDPFDTGATITHARLMTLASGGNPLTKIKALAAPKVVGAGDVLKFPVGEIDFEIQ